ncbi:MAG TPA: serine protease [Methylomirabilota bacterium]|nr:serine protease [Methylomirabilota bacterium]
MRPAFLPLWSCFATLSAAMLLLSPNLKAQQAGGLAAAGPQVRMVRSVVGAKGEARNGSFVMTEPRSTFYVPDDREVIVYFEWEGTKGVHHCEGNVRGPNNEFASMSSFDYTATQPRFAGFWKVPLSESSPAGIWVFESKVDGETAGSVTFQVVVASKPENLEKARPIPTPAELYRQTLAATVEVEKLDDKGRLLRKTSGFFLKDGIVVTSFRSIDGATALRIRVSDGKTFSSPGILAWNRRQDWALLSTSAVSALSLQLPESKTWNIGDHCSWLNTKTDGTRILSDGQIVGSKAPAVYGERIDISGVYDSASLGGPLLNDYAEVIGVLGGALPESLLNAFASQSQADASEVTFASTGGIAVSSSLLPKVFPASGSTLQDIWTKGDMTVPVVNAKYILFGMLSQGQNIKGKTFTPAERDLKTSFRRSDNTAGVLIHFANSDNFKAVATIRLYDVDNRELSSGKPEKISVSRGQFAERLWQFPISNLPAGIYRIDVELDGGVAWRQYFKITD